MTRNLYRYFNIRGIWSTFEFSLGWNNGIAASGSERMMGYWFFILGCFPIQKFSVKLIFADNLVIHKPETHYPNIPAGTNLPKSKILDKL